MVVAFDVELSCVGPVAVDELSRLLRSYRYPGPRPECRVPEWSIQLRRYLREAWSIHFGLPMMQHLATVVLFIVVASHLPLATAFELIAL